ncbi:MAG: hypothetical protein KME26_23790 [Oscillatoria princeps RMCB-10]|nr:hypothetical protein [Oscillatoria princeps RMCB-10]
MNAGAGQTATKLDGGPAATVPSHRPSWLQKFFTIFLYVSATKVEGGTIFFHPAVVDSSYIGNPCRNFRAAPTPL